jgi:hypothetical protein
MLLNGKGPDRHPLDDVSCRDLGMISSERGSDYCFLSNVVAASGCSEKICKDLPIIEGVKGKKLVEPTKIRLDS